MKSTEAKVHTIRIYLLLSQRIRLVFISIEYPVLKPRLKGKNYLSQRGNFFYKCTSHPPLNLFVLFFSTIAHGIIVNSITCKKILNFVDILT